MSKSRKEKSEQEQVLLFELPRTQVKTDSAVGFFYIIIIMTIMFIFYLLL